MKKKKYIKETDKRNHRENTNKIIHNNYFGSSGFEKGQTNFKIEEASTINYNTEDSIYYNELIGKIHVLITNNETFKQMNDLSKDKILKPNKSDVNNIWFYMIKKLPEYSKIDIFSVLHDYFDMDYIRFYGYLSNVFKSELLEELQKTNYSKNIFKNKLF